MRRRRYMAEILPIRRNTLYIQSMSNPYYLVMNMELNNLIVWISYTFIVYIRAKCILFWISYQTLLFYIGHIHKFVDMFIWCMSEIGNLIDQNIVYSSEYIRCFIIHIDSLCKRTMQFFYIKDVDILSYFIYHWLA